MSLMPESWFHHVIKRDFTLGKAKKEYICYICRNKFNKNTYRVSGSNKYATKCITCFLKNSEAEILKFKESCKEHISTIRKLQKKVKGKRVIQQNVISQL